MEQELKKEKKKRIIRKIIISLGGIVAAGFAIYGILCVIGILITVSAFMNLFGMTWGPNNLESSNTVILGHYEQNNILSDGMEEIEWIVLKEKDGKALVVSKYALDGRDYHNEMAEVTWEDCDLRRWLNEEFINIAFTPQEQKRILQTTVENNDNEEYETYGGNDTQDKIFLLSIEEARECWNRTCVPTDYAIANGVAFVEEEQSCLWMLRSPGNSQRSYAFVYHTGRIGQGGVSVWDDSEVDFGIRPAMWIELD